ncbi:site-2 protease family protein [Frigoribacterium sp. CG_9.8]|uniref:M50 family metallopeptidase n=1 Tax=Frigoribacterium sp. CG_9.8 TaxID=2787733 RepID=UPI0018CBE726|nr:membrane-associated protease RseP (regulator of RpoE activity) [Frigoribacterium sp. CG_9.8]
METVLLYILGIVVVLVGIALSIGLHEVGHLVPAKLFGVKVAQYMIGFGPTLFSRRVGETEYGVKAIPLGGYISMAGMYPPARAGGASRTSGTDAAVLEEGYEAGGRTSSTGFFQTLVQDARTASADTITAGDEDRVFYKLPIYKRVIIMLGGPFMNLVIAAVLFAVVLSGFGTQQLAVGSVSACVLPASSTADVCSPSDPEAPGSAAGLKPGDQIIKVAAIDYPTWDQVTEVIRTSAGKNVQFTVHRAGETRVLTAVPLLSVRNVLTTKGAVVTDANGTPVTERVGFLGIGPDRVLARQPLSRVIPTLGTTMAADVNLILNLPQRLIDVGKAAFGPGVRDPNGPVSVVGVGRIAGEVTATQTSPFAERFSFLLGLIASLNVALMVFNLVPLLPLDGGHVAGALWEGIRRAFAKLFRRPDPGPVDVAKLVPVTLAVVLVLGAMSILLIYADIVKPIVLQ